MERFSFDPKFTEKVYRFGIRTFVRWLDTELMLYIYFQKSLKIILLQSLLFYRYDYARTAKNLKKSYVIISEQEFS